MIHKIISIDDEFLEKIYTESMKELNDFYEIDWVHHTPKLFILDNRKTIDFLKDRKSEDWSVGWTEGRNVYLLDRDNLEEESSHKYSYVTYRALVKHELSHCFYSIISKSHPIPIWLWEGIAIYTSGQNQFKKKITKYEKFLDSYDNHSKGVYDESGFFVEALVNKYGKQKLFDFIKELKNIKTKEEYEKLFAKEYGFNLNYEEI